MNKDSLTKIFYKIAMNATSPDISDKVAYKKGKKNFHVNHNHAYHEMYGQFLLPKLYSIRDENKGIRFFEIGLGCNHLSNIKKKGVYIWQALFNDPKDKVWEVDVSKECVDSMIKSGGVPTGIIPLIGDQGNVTDLLNLVQVTGGNFDVIIDDGGHRNSQIFTSFNTLWPHLAPGGLYFMEDLQVGRAQGFEDSNGKTIMVEVIKDWIEQLVISFPRLYTHKIPSQMKSVTCINHACVMVKCEDDDIAWCST